jgi:hypothetical protein
MVKIPNFMIQVEFNYSLALAMPKRSFVPQRD